MVSIINTLWPKDTVFSFQTFGLLGFPDKQSKTSVMVSICGPNLHRGGGNNSRKSNLPIKS